MIFIPFADPGTLSTSSLAPLSLCLFEKFDLKDESTFCPPERDALADIFRGLKGNEWTDISETIPGSNDSIEWLDEYETYCKWFGISCDGAHVTSLSLRHNGLSGHLSSSIGKLHLLGTLYWIRTEYP